MNPEVVATSPCRIKSPVPVCCGFGSVAWWPEAEGGGHAPQARVDRLDLFSKESQLLGWFTFHFGSPRQELHLRHPAYGTGVLLLNYGAGVGAAPGICVPLCRLRVGCIALYACAAMGWRKAEGMLPKPFWGSNCFRNSPGALVRFVLGYRIRTF